jgi:hypothetical protein
MQEIGKLLILLGSVALVLGIAFFVGGRIPWFGRLPGDVVIQRGPVTFYFPIVTSIIVSVVLTLVLNLFWRR